MAHPKVYTIFFFLKVWGFNVQRFEDEIGLVLSDVDIKQFEVTKRILFLSKIFVSRIRGTEPRE